MEEEHKITEKEIQNWQIVRKERKRRKKIAKEEETHKYLHRYIENNIKRRNNDNYRYTNSESMGGKVKIMRERKKNKKIIKGEKEDEPIKNGIQTVGDWERKLRKEVRKRERK